MSIQKNNLFKVTKDETVMRRDLRELNVTFGRGLKLVGVHKHIYIYIYKKKFILNCVSLKIYKQK